MFSLGYLFGIFGTNNQQMRLLQLLKQFDRRASLGFTVEGCPSLTSPTLGYKKEFQRELLFRQDDVSVFKIEPMPTVRDNVSTRLNRINYLFPFRKMICRIIECGCGEGGRTQTVLT